MDSRDPQRRKWAEWLQLSLLQVALLLALVFCLSGTGQAQPGRPAGAGGSAVDAQAVSVGPDGSAPSRR